MRSTESWLCTFINVLTALIVIQLESIRARAVIGPCCIDAVTSLADTTVLQAFIDILAVVSKHRCSVTLVAQTLEGALCVPALPVRAEVTVLAFVNIFTLVFSR